LPSEALRCLVEDDAESGRRVAATLTTLCEFFGREAAAIFEPDDWQTIHLIVSSASIGVTYDWIYGYMTDEQRGTVRDFIAKTTAGKRSIGTEEVPAIPAVTSNWTTIHMSFVPMILAIEGEAGYDLETYQAYVEGMKKWIYVASGPLGAPFEGLAKSTYAPDWSLPMAKRGDPMIGSQWSINHVRRFQLGIMLPWGNQFVMESHVGLPRRELAFKYAHPDDPVVDFIYAQTAGTRRLFGVEATPEWMNIRTTYSTPWELPYYIQSPSVLSAEGSYDFEQHRSDLYTYLQAIDEPLTYYSDYRGLLTVRTGWDVDAAFLYFEPRNVPGGHTFDARNDFVFASHGRLWSTRGTYWGAEGHSDRRSVILIDGKGQGHQCLPGKTLELVETDEATFCAGDATMAYSYRAGGTSDPFYTETPNQSRLEPSKLPWMDLTWGELPGWLKGDKGGDRHSRIMPFNPVEYAYRTVGLIQGDHPYLVLADDMKKDDAEHQYDWLMQVPLDLSLLEASMRPDGAGEILLGDEAGRRLKLCVFSAGVSRSELEALVAGARLEQYEWRHHQNTQPLARVVLPLRSELGRFRIAMIPYRVGETVPLAAWDAHAEMATIQIGSQVDRIAMQEQDGQRVRMTFDRAGQRTVIGAK
jgi:hypothetical protein